MAKKTATKTKAKAKSKTKKYELPDKMSDLIYLALHDLSEVEKMKKVYSVDMDTWHSPNGRCSVCFAGSVMARTCGLAPDISDTSHKFRKGEWTKFDVLDALRLGHVLEAASLLGIKLHKKSPLVLRNVSIVEYELDPKLFKKEMMMLANQLDAVGL